MRQPETILPFIAFLEATENETKRLYVIGADHAVEQAGQESGTHSHNWNVGFLVAYFFLLQTLQRSLKAAFYKYLLPAAQTIADELQEVY